MIDPLGLSHSNSFIRLQAVDIGTSLYVTYRTAVGCDAGIDPQFVGKLAVYTHSNCSASSASDSDGESSGWTSASPSFLVALVLPGTQWTSSQMADPAQNVIVYLVQELQTAYGGSNSTSARIGVCRFESDPSECNSSLSQQPKLVNSALPKQHCNMNGVCESVFRENGQNCPSDCRVMAESPQGKGPFKISI